MQNNGAWTTWYNCTKVAYPLSSCSTPSFHTLFFHFVSILFVKDGAKKKLCMLCNYTYTYRYISEFLLFFLFCLSVFLGRCFFFAVLAFFKQLKTRWRNTPKSYCVFIFFFFFFHSCETLFSPLLFLVIRFSWLFGAFVLALAFLFNFRKIHYGFIMS